MPEQIMSADEARFALAQQVPEMQHGFTIISGYGSMTIPAGPAACKFAEFTRQMLAGESDDLITIKMTREEHLALDLALEDRAEHCAERSANCDPDYWQEQESIADTLLEKLRGAE